MSVRTSIRRYRRGAETTPNWFLEPMDPGDLAEGTTTLHPDLASGLNNASNSSGHSYKFYKTEQLTFLYILLGLIVVGNVAVLVAIFLSKKRKSRMNFFIMHLAIADLLSGMVIVSAEIAMKTTEEWLGGPEGCKILKYLESVVLFASTYVLVALSIDRLDAIANPMNFSGSGKRAKTLVIVAWGLSAGFSIPLLLLFQEKEFNHKKQCHMSLPLVWGWKLYMTTLAMILFIIPAIIICSCYSIIISVIWRKSSLTSTQFRNGHVNSKTTTLQETRTSGRGLIPKARIKTVKMTLVIVFAFVLCWSPFFIFNVLDVYGLIPFSQQKIAISIFIQSLSSLNCAANPAIYCLFSTRICQNWRRVLVCDWLARRICCTKDASPRRSITNGTDFTSVVTESRAQLRANNNCRRHSSTPFVRVTLSERDNEILLRHIKSTDPKGYSNDCGDNLGETVSSV